MPEAALMGDVPKFTGTNSRTSTSSHSPYRSRSPILPRRAYRKRMIIAVKIVEETIHSSIFIRLQFVKNGVEIVDFLLG